MRAVTTATKNDTSIVLPTIETIKRSFHNCIISTFDLSSMFYNIAEESIPSFNVYIDNSIWSHGRLPQCWCSSPKIASEAMQDFKKANNLNDMDFPFHEYDAILDQFVDDLAVYTKKQSR